MENKQFTIATQEAQNFYLGKLNETFNSNSLSLSASAKNCIIHTISTLQELVSDKGKSLAHLGRTNVAKVLEQVASLELDPFAKPRECYIILRNGKNDTFDIEFGVEGSGWETLVRKHGVDFESKVHEFTVYEGDEFTAGYFDGEKAKYILPTHRPKLPRKPSAKILFHVVIIKHKNGEIVAHIGERDMATNSLKSKVIQDATRKTYNKFSKSWENPKFTEEEVRKDFEDKTWDEAIAMEKYQSYFGPAYRNQTEAMVLRKLKNFCWKQEKLIFSNTLQEKSMESIRNDGIEYDFTTKTNNNIESYNELSASEIIAQEEELEQETDLNDIESMLQQ